MSGIVVTVLGLVGGAPGGETPRVADLSAAGAGRFFHNSLLPSKQLASESLARPAAKLELNPDCLIAPANRARE